MHCLVLSLHNASHLTQEVRRSHLGWLRRLIEDLDEPSTGVRNRVTTTLTGERVMKSQAEPAQSLITLRSTDIVRTNDEDLTGDMTNAILLKR